VSWSCAMLAVLAVAACFAGPARAQDVRIRSVHILKPDLVEVNFTQAPARTDAENFRFAPAQAPDVPIPVTVERVEGSKVILKADRKLDRTASYQLDVREPPLRRPVKPSVWAMMMAVILSSALINNFVFTRYLGLCVFFGTSRKRETAVGMGVTFTAVMIASAVLSWVLFAFVMKPLHLRFLQIIVFIGVVAFMVQVLDTVLKKIMRPLHQKFGIYLVLITTNCIILAVPLLNASADADGFQSFALALGSGVGFAIALFLMSCARERLEYARVPKCLQGLPIAFALTGLFALAFMGFSGLEFFR
jgi:electron transport complex protein RnfA